MQVYSLILLDFYLLILFVIMHVSWRQIVGTGKVGGGGRGSKAWRGTWVVYLERSFLELHHRRVVKADTLGIYQDWGLLRVLRMFLDPDKGNKTVNINQGCQIGLFEAKTSVLACFQAFGQ